MSKAPVLLEGYARMRAEIEAGTLRDDVLARAGVSADDWMSAQRTWLESMGTELERGRFELTNRYTKAFLERQRELTTALPKEAPPAVEAAAIPVAQPAIAIVETPFPSPGAPPPFQASPARASLASTAPSLSFAGPALPWNTDPTATGVLDPAMIRAALPFMRELDASDDASDDEPEPPTLDDGAETLLPSTTLASLRSAVAPTSAVQPSPPEPPGDGTLTMTGTIDPAIIRAALPFARDAVATPVAARAPEPPVGSETQTLPADLIARITKGALPFPRSQTASPSPSPSASPAAPALTIEQYASLCAELAASPQQTDAIFRKYGLESTRERLNVDLGWQERLRRDPAEHRKWQELYQRYHAYWLEQARRGPRR